MLDTRAGTNGAADTRRLGQRQHDPLEEACLRLPVPHNIVIHRWGWTIPCHQDGTTTATSPGGRVLHSHSPPRQAA